MYETHDQSQPNIIIPREEGTRPHHIFSHNVIPLHQRQVNHVYW